MCIIGLQWHLISPRTGWLTAGTVIEMHITTELHDHVNV